MKYYEDTPHIIRVFNQQLAWKAELISYLFLFQEQSSKFDLTYKYSRCIWPKSGWNKFVEDLENMGVLTLPDCTEINKYPHIHNSDGLL